MIFRACPDCGNDTIGDKVYECHYNHQFCEDCGVSKANLMSLLLALPVGEMPCPICERQGESRNGCKIGKIDEAGDDDDDTDDEEPDDADTCDSGNDWSPGEYDSSECYEYTPSVSPPASTPKITQEEEERLLAENCAKECLDELEGKSDEELLMIVGRSKFGELHDAALARLMVNEEDNIFVLVRLASFDGPQYAAYRVDAKRKLSEIGAKNPEMRRKIDWAFNQPRGRHFSHHEDEMASAYDVELARAALEDQARSEAIRERESRSVIGKFFAWLDGLAGKSNA